MVQRMQDTCFHTLCTIVCAQRQHKEVSQLSLVVVCSSMEDSEAFPPAAAARLHHYMGSSEADGHCSRGAALCAACAASACRKSRQGVAACSMRCILHAWTDARVPGPMVLPKRQMEG